MKEPTVCSVCGSKTFLEKRTEEVNLPARKAVVTTWSCLLGHLQQTEEMKMPEEWADYVYPGVFIP